MNENVDANRQNELNSKDAKIKIEWVSFFGFRFCNWIFLCSCMANIRAENGGGDVCVCLTDVVFGMCCASFSDRFFPRFFFSSEMFEAQHRQSITQPNPNCTKWTWTWMAEREGEEVLNWKLKRCQCVRVGASAGCEFEKCNELQRHFQLYLRWTKVEEKRNFFFSSHRHVIRWFRMQMQFELSDQEKSFSRLDQNRISVAAAAMWGAQCTHSSCIVMPSLYDGLKINRCELRRVHPCAQMPEMATVVQRQKTVAKRDWWFCRSTQKFNSITIYSVCRILPTFSPSFWHVI